MDSVKEYKCPCCDGGIVFDAASQNMKCPWCGTEFELETLEGYENELKNDKESNMQWDTDGKQEWNEEEKAVLRSYVCDSCGGELICDSTTAATECPYCKNPVVVTDRLSGTLRPDVVIPFKIDKKAAVAALKNHYKGKKLLPKVFADENRLDEIKGIYVPFWLFDADAEASIRYRATRMRMWSDSRYDYTETSFYSVSRDGSLSFERVPVDGSVKIADDLMESLEPFDFSQATDFNTAYLSGYLADKYDVDAKSSIPRANERIKKSTEDAFAATVTGYHSVTPVSSSINLTEGKALYALYPVWLLSTEWNGKKYTFAMNGQTGKFVGNLPLDKKAYLKWLFGLAGIVGAVCFALITLLWFM